MWDLGDVVPLAVDVKNAAGALTNATTIALTITLPDGTTATPTVTNPPAVTGRYTYDYQSAQAGRHTVRWVSTTPNAAYTDAFDVDVAAPSGVVSLADVKAHLNLTATTHDEELRLFIDSATDAVEHLVGPVVKRTVVERVRAYGAAMILAHVPVVSVTSIAAAITGGTTYEVADLSLSGDAGLLYRLDGASFASTLNVTYVAGRAIVPPAIRLAALIIVGHLWETQRGATPAALAQGAEEAPVLAGFALPNRALELLRPFQLGPGIA
jgi:hypothetical protein